MKIYVENLPKNCADCPCRTYHEYWDESYCNVKGNTIEDIYEKQENCPLQPLADYTKQVRKEVCDEIRDLAGNYFELPICYNCGEASNDDVVLTGNDLTEILDQIQGEINGYR